MDVTDEHLGRALDALAARDGASDDVPEFGDDLSRDDRFDVVTVLLRQGLITATTNFGDNRLLGARNLRMTAAGHAQHQTLLSRAASSSAPAPEDRILTFDEKRSLRLAVIAAIYRTTDGSERRIVDVADLAASIGTGDHATREAVRYLTQEGLIRNVAWGAIGITHAGIVEYEHTLSSPSEPTSHFPASINVLNIGSMVGSNVQQGTAGGSQTLEYVTPDVRTELLELVERVRVEASRVLDADSDELDELVTELDVIERQLGAKRPRSKTVAGGVARVASLLTQLGAGAQGASELAQLALRLHEVMPGI